MGDEEDESADLERLCRGCLIWSCGLLLPGDYTLHDVWEVVV